MVLALTVSLSDIGDCLVRGVYARTGMGANNQAVVKPGNYYHVKKKRRHKNLGSKATNLTLSVT